MRAIILAGGRGTRLQPHTAVFPKPLVPVGDMPVMEILIRQLAAHGVNHATIAIGHLGDLISTYFGDGSRFGLKIDYSRETKPMGTAGALGLIDDIKDDFLVLNGDVLTTMRFDAFMDYHRRMGGPATIAMHRKLVQIPLGVIHLNGGNRIKAYIEKPNMDYLASMGVYAFTPSILKYLPLDAYFDFPDLIHALLHDDIPVISYRCDAYWADIGTPDEYVKAVAEFESRKSEFLNTAPDAQAEDTGVLLTSAP